MLQENSDFINMKDFSNATTQYTHLFKIQHMITLFVQSLCNLPDILVDHSCCLHHSDLKKTLLTVF